MSDIYARTYDAWLAVTPNDATADPQGPFAGLFIGGTAGTLKFTDAQGNTVTLSGTIPTGTEIHAVVQRVWSTGTTATAIYGLRAMPIKPKVSS